MVLHTLYHIIVFKIIIDSITVYKSYICIRVIPLSFFPLDLASGESRYIVSTTHERIIGILI